MPKGEDAPDSLEKTLIVTGVQDQCDFAKDEIASIVAKNNLSNKFWRLGDETQYTVPPDAMQNHNFALEQAN